MKKKKMNIPSTLSLNYDYMLYRDIETDLKKEKNQSNSKKHTDKKIKKRTKKS